jgi:hypothetical protein
MKAWLVTWERMGSHAQEMEPIAAILNSRTSGKRVLEIVELIYANEMYTLSERMLFARDKKRNPYQANYVTYQGAPCNWEIRCGHNPWLRARLVTDLKLISTENAQQTLTWKEPREWISNWGEKL